MAFYVALNSQEASFERADVVVRKRLQLRLRDSWAVLADAQEGFPTCGASKTGREALRLVKATVAEGESGDSHTVDLTGALAGELTWCPLARAGGIEAGFFVGPGPVRGASDADFAQKARAPRHGPPI